MEATQFNVAEQAVNPVTDKPFGFGLIATLFWACDPITAGLLPTTRTLYLLLDGNPNGRLQLMLPLVVLAIEPITVGDVKLPSLSLSSAVKTLPGLKAPLTIYPTVVDAPAQKGPFSTFLVLMESCANESELKNVNTMNERKIFFMRQIGFG